MDIPQAVEFGHYLLARTVGTGDFVIDATCGNGHDTSYLAKLVGDFGQVLAVDIQEKAVQRTREELAGRDLLDRVKVIQGDHSRLVDLIEDQELKPRAIVFNLGYLPGGDKEIITEVESTLPALKQAAEILAVSGILVITAYPGHEGGDVETEEINKWAEQLDGDKFNVIHYHFINQDTPPPEVYAVMRR